MNQIKVSEKDKSIQPLREKNPKFKRFIAQIVKMNPKILQTLKSISSKINPMAVFDGDESISQTCLMLKSRLPHILTGQSDADDYHNTMLGILTVLFYPKIIQPHKEWEINDGRKRIDIVFTNSADEGFFAHRRDGNNTQSNSVIVECKNYTNDICNPEVDQLIGRFDINRGKFGIITCREIEDEDKLLSRLRDAAKSQQGFIIALTDSDIVQLLDFKSVMDDPAIEEFLHNKFRDLIA